MGSAFHQLCPRYSQTLTPNAPAAIRLWETIIFFYMACMRFRLIDYNSTTACVMSLLSIDLLVCENFIYFQVTCAKIYEY